MKKALLTLAAIVGMVSSASAADLAAKPYYKAPMAAAAPNWTGLYIFGGAGGGLWDAKSSSLVAATGVARGVQQKFGGDGWFGTVGAGYDWQFGGWVVGIFGDGQFGSLSGSIGDGVAATTGNEKEKTAYAGGARLGYLVAPNVLSYVNAGYSGSRWSSSVALPIAGGPATYTTPSFTRDGFFFGGGFENNLNIFGITAPGWFMKTEYRSAYYGKATLPENLIAGGTTGFSTTFKPLVQTISTSLVYRFNWGSPVVAKY
jgi:outer membrane immunogenic protein